MRTRCWLTRLLLLVFLAYIFLACIYNVIYTMYHLCSHSALRLRNALRPQPPPQLRSHEARVTSHGQHYSIKSNKQLSCPQDGRCCGCDTSWRRLLPVDQVTFRWRRRDTFLLTWKHHFTCDFFAGICTGFGLFAYWYAKDKVMFFQFFSFFLILFLTCFTFTLSLKKKSCKRPPSTVHSIIGDHFYCLQF